MAVEVASRSLQFWTPKETKASLREQIRSRLTVNQISGWTSNVKSGIFHNYLHDLESLWWILVWSTFKYEKAPAMDDEDSVGAALNQKTHYLSLFPGHRRQSFLKDDTVFKEIVAQIPTSFHKQQEVIILYRLLLITEYFSEETGISKPVFLSDPDPLHDVILASLLEREFVGLEVVSVLDRESESERLSA